jgi:hypothetical protein
MDADLLAEFTKIVNQVEGKAVVIVDQDDHLSRRFPPGS